MLTIFAVKDSMKFDLGLRQTLPVKFSRRVHRFGDEHCGSTVIQFALNPIKLLLFVQPSLWQRIGPERAAASSQQVGHGQGVVALRLLELEVRPNTSQEGFGAVTGWASPGPARSC